jgi:hypothetical protein
MAPDYRTYLLGQAILLLRALVIGVLTALLVSPIIIWTLNVLVGVDGLAFWAFVAFKASLAAALAAVVIPIVAMRTLEDGVQASGVRSIAGY